MALYLYACLSLFFNHSSVCYIVNIYDSTGFFKLIPDSNFGSYMKGDNWIF